MGIAPKARTAGRVAAGSDASEPGVNRHGSRLNNKNRKNKGTGAGGKKKGGGGGGGLGKFYGGHGGYKGVRVKKARRLVQGIIRPELAELRRERRGIRMETQAGRARAENLYKRSIGDLEHIYGETDEEIDRRNAVINSQYAATRDQTAAANAALSAQLQQSGTQTGVDINAELARLGISGGADMGAYMGDQAFAQGQAAVNTANTSANVGAMGANAGAVGELLGNINAGSHTSAVGKASNARSDSLFELEQNKLKGFNEVRNAMRDLKGTRKDAILQVLEQLSQTGWAQYMEGQQLNMQRQAHRRAMRGGGGGGGSGSGSSGSSSSGGTGTGTTGYYGGKTDAMIDALSGGSPNPSKPGGKKKKRNPIPIRPNVW